MKRLLLSSPFILVPLVAPAAHAITMQNPSLSPDGSKVVFQNRTSTGIRLFIADLNGKNARQLGAASRGDDIEPSWRADGKEIAFASNRGGNYDLYAVAPNGTGLRQITKTPGDERSPQWSPRAFTLREGSTDNGAIVPGRSKTALPKTELQLIEKLAGGGKVWDKYMSDASGPTFDENPKVRFYKLLSTYGNGANRRILTLREDGKERQFFSSGMAGAHFGARWERTGLTVAFLRATGDPKTGNALYFAPYPVSSEIFNENGDRIGFGPDWKEWDKQIKKVTQNVGDTIQITPNGEFVSDFRPAVRGTGRATGPRLFLYPRRDLQATLTTTPTIFLPNDATGAIWNRNGKQALAITSRGLVPVANPEPLADVLNWLEFSTPYDDNYDSLQRADRPLLAKNSFVATGSGARQMFGIYEETDYQNLPVFISSDSLLHLNHLVFDSLLREVEQENLTPASIDLIQHYLSASLNQAKSLSDEGLKNDALANAAYWAVAARLIRGEVKTGLENTSTDPQVVAERARRVAKLNQLTAPLTPLLAALPAEAKAMADGEIKLITTHAGRSESPIFGGKLTGVGQPNQPLLDTRLDYSNFIPRGHYTRTEVLRRYFLMSRWLSDAPFRPVEAHARRALLMVAASTPQSLGKIQTVSRVIAQFIGDADDATFTDYVRLSRQVYGGALKASDISDEAKMGQFLALVNKLPKPKIAASMGAALRLYPQPYTLDAAAMQNLVYDRSAPDVGTENQPRYFALGLDAMGVLGSDRARQLLNTFSFGGSFFDFGLKESQYANYDKQFRAERAKIAVLTSAQWQKNFYSRTLWALKPLLSKQAQPQYRFTQNGAWTDKQLNAALATWAELKHDTLPKQPVAVEAGGEGGMTEVVLEEQPQGAIEPSPEVFKRLKALVDAEKVSLTSAGYLSATSKNRLDAFSSLLDMVIRLEAKQRAGKPWTRGESEQLRFYGTFLEHLTLISLEGQSETMEDSDMAIIADVASAYSTVLKQQAVLEEGVGHAIPLYVAIERNGGRVLTRGAAFTYYEFTQPASQRLTDKGWQDLLRTPKRPGLPFWTKSFIARLKEN